MELCISFPIVEKYHSDTLPPNASKWGSDNNWLLMASCFLTTSKLMHLHKKLSANIPITQYILAESVVVDVSTFELSSFPAL